MGIINGLSNINHTIAALNRQTHLNNSYHDPEQISDYIDAATLPLHDLYSSGGEGIIPVHRRQPTTYSATTTSTEQDSPNIRSNRQTINDIKLMTQKNNNSPRTDL